jgi:tRNA threonylcarbamoyladenosine biosynthesis protein TsaE
MAPPKSKIHNPKFPASVPLVERLSGSVEETQALGERLGAWLRPGDVAALHGELGTGKTTLVQGIARGLGCRPGSIKSPTFVLVREYPGDIPLIHVDGYRLSGSPAAAWLDLELLLGPRKITLIEWAERFSGLLPERHLEVHLSHVSVNRRRLRVSAAGEWPAERLAALREALNSATSDRGTTEQPDGTSGD